VSGDGPERRGYPSALIAFVTFSTVALGLPMSSVKAGASPRSPIQGNMRGWCEHVAPRRDTDVANDLVQRYDPFEEGLGFALATRVGTLVYTSGMVGVDADFNVPEDAAEEFRCVFQNLAGVLEAMGTSLDHVVDSTNFFVGDVDAIYPVFEEVRKELFAGRLPASTSVVVAKLLDPRVHVEVKLTAVVPES